MQTTQSTFDAISPFCQPLVMECCFFLCWVSTRDLNPRFPAWISHVLFDLIWLSQSQFGWISLKLFRQHLLLEHWETLHPGPARRGHQPGEEKSQHGGGAVVERSLWRRAQAEHWALTGKEFVLFFGMFSVFMTRSIKFLGIILADLTSMILWEKGTLSQSAALQFFFLPERCMSFFSCYLYLESKNGNSHWWHEEHWWVQQWCSGWTGLLGTVVKGWKFSETCLNQALNLGDCRAEGSAPNFAEVARITNENSNKHLENLVMW